MIQDIFSPARFAAYFRKYTFDNRSRLGITLLTVVLIPILFCVGIPAISPCYSGHPNQINSIYDPMWDREIFIFTLFFIALGAAFGSAFYDVLIKKTSRISLFTLPASSLEKFATFFSIYAILFPLVTLGSAFLADAIRVWIYESRATPGIAVDYLSIKMLISYGKANPLIENPADELTLLNTALWLATSLTVPALYTLGSSVWPKNSFLKSTAFIFAFNSVAGYMMYLGFTTFFGMGPMYPRPFLDADTDTVSWLIIGISTAVAVFFYAVSYFRMKEWEVIKRW